MKAYKTRRVDFSLPFFADFDNDSAGFLSLLVDPTVAIRNDFHYPGFLSGRADKGETVAGLEVGKT